VAVCSFCSYNFFSNSAIFLSLFSFSGLVFSELKFPNHQSANVLIKPIEEPARVHLIATVEY